MKKNSFDLSGRVALVTGGSRGIGESIARLLADNGAHVIVSSRKIEACEKVAASIRDDGGSAEAIACHIGELDSIATCVDAVIARHGRVDILVNNAAANPYFGPVLDTPLDAFQKTVDVNIRGYFVTSTIVGKHMRAAGKGTIVNVASVNGVVPGPGQGIYSITKAAIIAMTRSMAKECAGAGIRVNALLPGLTDTKFASSLTKNEAILDAVMPMIPMRRIAEPDEMAGAVLYLVSDAASYTTGLCMNVDGGMLA
jgi:NAD(P)-dependent dehydrogenase (short-subunit alcohol dehydrogenase family)